MNKSMYNGYMMDDEMIAIVKKLEDEMACNCDLDRWQPERDTSHSWVCPIHKEAKRLLTSKKSPECKDEGERIQAQ